MLLHQPSFRCSARFPPPAGLHKCTPSAVPQPKRTIERRVSLRFCELCGTGRGLQSCPVCQGSGEVTTQPGGAGKPFYVGMARCKQCSGIGEIPCPMCAGWERSMKVAQSSRIPDNVCSADKTSCVKPPDLTWLDEL